MTTNEALNLVRQTEECWIVFSSATGEVLAVAEDRAGQTAQDKFTHLGSLSQYNQPVMTRCFKSATVNREVLEREQVEAERVNTRVRILTEWSKAATEELMQVLESGRYDYPMSKSFDSQIIVDDLWELHRDELQALPRERLWTILSNGVLGAAAIHRLRIYLAALDGDERHLKAIWMRKEPGRTCVNNDIALMDAFAYVRTKDTEIIGDMLDILKSDTFFSVKYDTMIALGKIGPVADLRTADIIRASITDSQPWVIAAQDRVLQRLEPANEWLVCGECCYGLTRDAEGYGVQSCPQCLGLGYRSAN